MKTKILLTALLMCGLSISILNANPGKLTNETKNKEFIWTDKAVGLTLEHMFSKAPLEDLIEGTENLNIKFRINEFNKMTDIKVTCDNKALSDYVYNKLVSESSSFGFVSPDKYSIDLVFVLKR